MNRKRRDCNEEDRGHGDHDKEKENRIISDVKKEIKKLGRLIMATKQEVLDAIAQEKTEIVAEIQALKDQLASGGTITPADLDEIIASVKGMHGETTTV